MFEDCLGGIIGLIDENFPEMDNDIIVELPKTDVLYAELSERRKELSGRFPIEKWLEASGALSLTAEEHTGLAEYNGIVFRMENIERKAIYYAGHRDCFLYLKEIGVV